MKKSIKILLTMVAICIFITGCSNDYTKYKSYSEEAAKNIIVDELKEKYPFINYNINFLDKSNVEVCAFWLDGCFNTTINGVYKYTFSVENDNREYKVYFTEPYKNKKENKIIEYNVNINELIRGENPYIIYNKANEYESLKYSFDNYEKYSTTQKGIIYGDNIFELKEFLTFLYNNREILEWNLVITNDKNIYNQLLNDKEEYDKYVTHYVKYTEIQGLEFTAFENNPEDTHIISYSNDLLDCKNTCTVIFS